MTEEELERYIEYILSSEDILEYLEKETKQNGKIL